MKKILEKMEKKYNDLSLKISETARLSPQEREETGIEFKRLSELLEEKKKYDVINDELEQAEDIMKESGDADMLSLAREEIDRCKSILPEIENRLKRMLIPPVEDDKKGIIIEIRAGTGGEEAALFAMEVYKMYSKTAERHRWKVDVISSNVTGMGGIKEIICSITGKNVYKFFKYESGTHRVQRVPVTETGGRLHTSAVTVAVLPEADSVELNVDPEKDLKIDVFRSSGPGGQSVNTTDSAVRITHLPTGLVVTCQDEKSQHKNKAKALKVLNSRLLEQQRNEQHKKRSDLRRTQVGTGDRSEKVRTYNFPQNRVTDHRINLDIYKLEQVLDGHIEEFVEKLTEFDTEKKLELVMKDN